MFLKTSLVFSCKFCASFQNQAAKFGQLIEREKCFSSKVMLKMRLGGLVSDFFLHFKKTSQKKMVKVAGLKASLLERDSSTCIFM